MKIITLVILSVLIELSFVSEAIAVPLVKVIGSTVSKTIDPYRDDLKIQVKCSGWFDKSWFVNFSSEEIQVLDKQDSKGYYVQESTLSFALPNDPAIESKDALKKIYAVDDGYLVSYYAGEWGGSLWWFSKDGKNKKAVLPYKPTYDAISFVKEFMPTKDGLYLLVGLSHLSLDSGGIIKVENTKEDGWRISKHVNLSSAALAYFKIDENAYLILTNKKVVYFSLKKGSMTLYEPLDGYPRSGVGGNSIARDNQGNIFIGDRYKVTRLKPVLGGYSEEWIIPEYCEWDVEDNGICHCQSLSDVYKK